MHTDKIIVDNGEMFEGNREQFANCYFDNAEDNVIIDWCKDNGFSLTINDVIYIDNKDSNSECKDPEHNFPSLLYIPSGQTHTHVCPRCGNQITFTAPNITL